jgi:hypothetical protein
VWCEEREERGIIHDNRRPKLKTSIITRFLAIIIIGRVLRRSGWSYLMKTEEQIRFFNGEVMVQM